MTDTEAKEIIIKTCNVGHCTELQKIIEAICIDKKL